MPRPIRAIIDPAAVAGNLNVIRRIAPRSYAWAVVKADAYGHGIARILSALGHADGIAVLDLDEAVLVRDLGWNKPILLLEGVFDPSDLDVVSRFGLTATVHCEDQLRMIECSKLEVPVTIYLKMNTGMN
ncbi:MAG TPA: alanine racemase, partial [Burkholderiales bacterium]